MTMHPGIDYGMGKTNRDAETGISYGVIPMHRLSEWAYEEFEAIYPPCSCWECGKEDEEASDGDPCPCGGQFCAAEEATGFVHEEPDEDTFAHFGEGGDVWIERSPFYTRVQFCSPCAPGAGYLLNPCEDGPKTYCLGHDWFEDGKAPYPVYRVSDDSLVEPEKE